MEQIMSTEETHSTELSFYLPKFKMEITFQLNDALIQLGIRNAFSYQSADFTGMIKKKRYAR
jgi:serine protease inhibitor